MYAGLNSKMYTCHLFLYQSHRPKASSLRLSASSMALLGDDGRGYDLSRKLEHYGVWRSWLGDSDYSSFVHFLSSPSIWESFMRTDDSKTRSQIQLQLRARALLFDKASVSLFLRANSPSATTSDLNPAYLQLHGDDVYFSLEDDSQDAIQYQEGSTQPNLMQTKAQNKVSISPSRLNEHSLDSRYSEPELFATWYDRFIKKYRSSRHHKFPYGDQESLKRTPDGMSEYLKLQEKHKKRQWVFKDSHLGFNIPVLENGSHTHTNVISDASSSSEEENWFFPEMMFPSNCVPDSALGPVTSQENAQKVEFYEVLDNLPPITSRNAVMIERFGVRPEYLSMGLGKRKYRGGNGSEGNKKSVSEEQATLMTKKVIARLMANVGLDGATEVSMEVLSQFLSCHIGKLGRTLRVLSDNYRKQCSAVELLKMFLQTMGCGNVRNLAEQLKDGTRVVSLQTQQQVRGLQSPHQSTLLQAQSAPFQRQMLPQMHMLHPQNLAFQQQQWDKLRKRQPSTPRGSAIMTSERDRPTVEVKVENPSEMPIDGSQFASINRQQLQFRQQQMVNHQAQSNHQIKQLSSLQVPQLQPQGMFSVRPQPVKVEAFQELMGGDSTSKHESEEHKRLTSPSK